MNIILWHRNDLRVHDLPALADAVNDGDNVIPVFILNDTLLAGKNAGSNRNRFLLEALTDLRNNYRKIGGDLIIRNGDPSDVLATLASESSADTIYVTTDYSPYSVKRDEDVRASLATKSINFISYGGRLAVDEFDSIRTKAGTVHKVFTPFWKTWSSVTRRPVLEVPKLLNFPKNIATDNLPELSNITSRDDLSPEALLGGETAGRQNLEEWLGHGIAQYDKIHNDLAADATSHISPYLHFGCLSVREIELRLPDNEGARAWHRQLAWREFYNYVLFYSPTNTSQEFQEKYRSLQWGQNRNDLEKWQLGMTGYPIVDAAMRQLKQTGWMHNRARLIVGSFFTKDLWLDWRLGERYFMKMLVDGDTANNNGNWQWIASVGVDPAPVYRRLYNPASQAKNYDPTGAYIRRFVPELTHVPDAYLAEPHLMPLNIQESAGCIIGRDYPIPMVDHKAARIAALERYRNV